MATQKMVGNVGSTLGTVIIGGGRGFIGAALTRTLRLKGYNVIIVSRQPAPYAITWSKVEKDGLPECFAVVNVAGQNVLDFTRRWTPGFQQNVWASRVNTNKALSQAINKMSKQPEVFVTVSGVGYYKPSLTEEYTEDSQGGNFDYFSRLCTDWENAAKLSGTTTRRVTIRSGVVLGRQGGMIKQIFLPFYIGTGGPIGDGKQYFPWIHLQDTVGIFIHAIENKNVSGILNGVAPHLITNGEFTKAFARALGRPAFIPLPVAILNILFSNERAKMMTEGQKVIPKRTLASGFKYKYPNINEACKEFGHLMYKDSLSVDIQ
uniref:DUF1731 domain-containing protein n=1 Tax=Strigamia maritima TaxID=126957 RepID=T1J546_STRMM